MFFTINWLTPIVILDPAAHTLAGDELVVHSTVEVACTNPSYAYDVHLVRNGREI